MTQSLLASPSLLLSLAIAMAASQIWSTHKSMAATSVAAYFLFSAIVNILYISMSVDGSTILATYIIVYLSLILFCASTPNPHALDKISACVYLLLMIETSILLLDFQIFPDSITWIYENDMLIQVSADIILITIGAIGAYLSNPGVLHRGNSHRG